MIIDINMNEEENFDELPAISVNSSASNSELVMPGALEVAQQRARALSAEREVREAREWYEGRARAGAEAKVARLPHSDSSGSEGEAALAAAVRALLVQTPSPARAPAPARLPLALARLAPTAAPAGAPLLTEYARALNAAPPHLAAALTDQMVSGVCSALMSGGGGGAEPACLAAWLCALAPAGGADADAGCRRARRALHALLDTCAGPDQVWEAARLLSEAAGEGAVGATGAEAARARLELGDAARSGGGAGADLLAALLYRRALAALLGAREAAEERAPLRPRELAALLSAPAAAPLALPAPARLALVQLAGRVLATGDGAAEGRADVLAALAPLAAPHARHVPDNLKVALGKLQLLFGAPPCPAPAPPPPDVGLAT